MERIFNFNGKTYKAAPFSFNTICDLERYGVSLADITERPLSTVRGYLGICGHMDMDAAGKEFEDAIINGEGIDSIMSVMREQIEESGFFQAINKTAEADNQESEEAETVVEEPTPQKKTRKKAQS